MNIEIGDLVFATPRGKNQTRNCYVITDISSVPLYHLQPSDGIGLDMFTTDVLFCKKGCNHEKSISARDSIDPRIEFCAYCGEKLT